MADEYIRKADAIGAIWHSIDGEFGELESYAHAVIGDADDAIEALEPVDVVPVVYSRWEYKCGEIQCHECGNTIHRIDLSGYLNFCPNCGAKMDGEE